MYFAIDISDGRKSHSAGNRYNQFREFIVLSSNLLEELGHRVSQEVLDEMQNPLHTVREILDSMINVGFPPDAAGALSITALTRGYGHEVCTALNWLLDQVLRRRRFKWKRPEYPVENVTVELDNTDVEQMVVHDDSTAGDNSQSWNQGVEEAPVAEEEYLHVVHHGSKMGDADDEGDAEMMENEVDPLVWKTELERVGPRLHEHSKKQTLHAKDWMAHLHTGKMSNDTMRAILPETQQLLSQLNAVLKQDLGRIERGEKRVNREHSKIVENFAEVLVKLNKLKISKSEKENDIVDNTLECQDLTDQLETVKDIMDTKGRSMTDTTPLVKLKSRIKQLQEEVDEMNVRSGVLEQRLMALRFKHQHEIHVRSEASEGKQGGYMEKGPYK